ncbi:hypothetical protein GGH94_004534 [Coemansia aciculifera]|uniref:Uncharacterized protein n=1 Tax=Coemansia aciculifera TaxID=417176 RepID=A0A9W8IF48_9FUNG|nr:hypothetical protein GGH94_004534 [Coemansia aciculifera]KAJ2869638.1 hypothetical protein GGH93_006096 [Coemansia aciculifera]
MFAKEIVAAGGKVGRVIRARLLRKRSNVNTVFGASLIDANANNAATTDYANTDTAANTNVADATDADAASADSASPATTNVTNTTTDTDALVIVTTSFFAVTALLFAAALATTTTITNTPATTTTTITTTVVGVRNKFDTGLLFAMSSADSAILASALFALIKWRAGQKINDIQIKALSSLPGLANKYSSPDKVVTPTTLI